ncbi:hypothetical protein ACEN2S_03985 [Phaeovulum sp. W22_SRMD_FR3]
MKLEMSRIKAGRWEAVVSETPEQPAVSIVHQEQPLAGLEAVQDGAERWKLSLPIPAELLSDGVQSFLVLGPQGERVTQFTIVTGVPLEDDIRAEVDLLRAELDMLKRAFRRHCVETEG